VVTKLEKSRSQNKEAKKGDTKGKKESTEANNKLINV